jgi:hypothetical protein
MSDIETPSDWMETPNAGKLRGKDPYAEWKKLERTAQMQASIMRDPVRTGGWEGSDKVADAFDDLAERVRELAADIVNSHASITAERDRLRGENERLRAALSEIATTEEYRGLTAEEAMRVAQTALKGGAA